MKINSNTISLTKESSDFQKIEEVIMKVAAVNGIKDVESVQIQLMPDKGIVGFKLAANEQLDPALQAQQAQQGQPAAGQPVAGQVPGQPAANPALTSTTGTPAQPGQEQAPAETPGATKNKEKAKYDAVVQGLDEQLEADQQQFSQQKNQ
jgi:hypothetical protein